MKYYSHYIWENGDVKGQNPVSLILQQVKLRKGRCLLACICDGTRSIENKSLVSGYITERLVEWFHGKCIPTLQITMNDAKIRHMLAEELAKIEEEVKEFEKQKGITADYDILGMTVWNDCFCCFWKGDCKGYIFNKRFNRKHVQATQVRCYPSGEVNTVCNVADVQLVLEVAGPHVTQNLLRYLTVQPRHTVHLLREVTCQY